jgi:hypothetical protein
MQAEFAINGVTSLELTMHDVLDGMEDFASQFGYQDFNGCFEILSIDPPHAIAPTRPKAAAPVALKLVAR